MDKEEEKKTTEASLGNLYDMNKIFIKDHEPELTEGNLNSKKQIIIDLFNFKLKLLY